MICCFGKFNNVGQFFFCRMMGMVRSVSKFPTYRRRFRQVVKDLVAYSSEKEASSRSNSMRSIASVENV